MPILALPEDTGLASTVKVRHGGACCSRSTATALALPDGEYSSSKSLDLQRFYAPPRRPDRVPVGA